MPAPRLYDLAVAGLDRAGLGPLRDELSRGLAGRVLEVGAGTGRQIAHHPPGVELTVTDPDPAALALARRRAPPGARVVVAPAEDLPFPDDAFDAVVVALALCTVADPARALAEIRRVLRPGGLLRALEHVRSSSPRLAGVQATLAPAWSRVAGGCRLDRDTEAAIASAGFTVTGARRMLAGALVLIAARNDDGPVGAGPS